MSAHVYYYYAYGPGNGSSVRPTYDEQGYMEFTGLKWSAISLEAIESSDDLHAWLALGAPQIGQMMIARLAYTQEDVQYGSEGYSTIDGAAIDIFMPLTISMDAVEPTFNISPVDSTTDILSIYLNGSEENSIFIKYGGLPSYSSPSIIIEQHLSGPAGLVTEMYTSLITRVNIPNIIRTNSKQATTLETMGDEASLNSSNFTISTAGTTTSY